MFLNQNLCQGQSKQTDTFIIFHPGVYIVTYLKKFLIFYFQNVMENPQCTSAPPEKIFVLLWTTIAVFGIVYTLLGEFHV